MGNSGENFEGYDYVGGGTMDFSTYSRLVTWFFENDNREENYQNRILIPLFEKLCKGNNVVDTSLLTKEWNKRKIDREAFAGTFTPDLLIASSIFLNILSILSAFDLQYKGSHFLDDYQIFLVKKY